MEFYKLAVNRKVHNHHTYYAIVHNGKITAYNKNMIRTYKYDDMKPISRALENFTLITDEDELAKLMLVSE